MYVVSQRISIVCNEGASRGDYSFTVPASEGIRIPNGGLSPKDPRLRIGISLTEDAAVYFKPIPFSGEVLPVPPIFYPLSVKAPTVCTSSDGVSGVVMPANNFDSRFSNLSLAVHLTALDTESRPVQTNFEPAGEVLSVNLSAPESIFSQRLSSVFQGLTQNVSVSLVVPSDVASAMSLRRSGKQLGMFCYKQDAWVLLPLSRYNATKGTMTTNVNDGAFELKGTTMVGAFTLFLYPDDYIEQVILNVTLANLATPNTPSILWLAVGSGVGFIILFSLAVLVYRFVCRRRSRDDNDNSMESAPPSRSRRASDIVDRLPSNSIEDVVATTPRFSDIASSNRPSAIPPPLPRKQDPPPPPPASSSPLAASSRKPQFPAFPMSSLKPPAAAALSDSRSSPSPAYSRPQYPAYPIFQPPPTPSSSTANASDVPLSNQDSQAPRRPSHAPPLPPSQSGDSMHISCPPSLPPSRPPPPPSRPPPPVHHNQAGVTTGGFGSSQPLQAASSSADATHAGNAQTSHPVLAIARPEAPVWPMHRRDSAGKSTGGLPLGNPFEFDED